MDSTTALRAPSETDVLDALAKALEHEPSLTRADALDEWRKADQRPALTAEERTKAAGRVRMAALESLGEEAKPVLDQLAHPRGYRLLNPTKAGPIKRPEFLIDGLIYEGRAHELFGRDGTNKTMLIVWMLASLAARELDVLLVEYEMDEDAIATFLDEMGFDRSALAPFFHQVVPERPWGAALLDELTEDFPQCSAVALDNVAEAIASFSGDENAAGDTLKALAPLRDLAHRPNGPAVIAADHLPHARDNAARGTTAKGALVDVAFQVETPHPVTRDRAGDIKLTCRKDRPSLIGKGSEVWFTVGDGNGGLPIRHIETPGKLTDGLSEDGASMIVRLQAYAEDNPRNPWLSTEATFKQAGLAKSRKREAELLRLANDPRQPIEQRTRARGEAAAVTEYRFAAVPEGDDALEI